MPKINRRNIFKTLAALSVSGALIYQYSRADYKHWIDADKDCQDTRQEVLIFESIEKVTLDQNGCKVIEGKWYDPYSNQYFRNSDDIDIDHFVPLAEVHRSGGNMWSKDKKMEYANDLDDPEVLIAVDKSANRSKGDKDPSDWLPPNKEFQCEYIKTWQTIKKKWKLSMDAKEQKFIDKKNQECKTQLNDKQRSSEH